MISTFCERLKENRGVAEVYKAVHKATKRVVAVKKMNSDHKALTMSSLINEISIMKTCRHENIVDFFDTYRVGGKQVRDHFILFYFEKRYKKKRKIESCRSGS